MGDAPRTKCGFESRREFLRAAGLTGGTAVLPVGQVAASSGRSRTVLDSDFQRESLLPAERTFSEPPKMEAETADNGGEEYFQRDEVGVDPAGRLSLDIKGGLDGEGKYGLTGAPTLETTWTAPRTGEHVVRARYRTRGGLHHDFGDGTLVSSFPKSTLAVLDTETGSATVRPFLDSGIVSPDIDEFLIEEGLEFLARRLVLPFFGPIGSIFARFIIDQVVDWIVPEPTGNDTFGRTYERQLRFWAKEGRTYRIRFYTSGGGAGASQSGSGSCRTRLTVETDLHELSVYPVGISMAHDLVVSKEGTPEGLGMYAVTVSDDLAREEGSEAEVEGRTALDWVGPKRGVDRLRYSGTIEEFLLKGNAVAYRDGSRIESGSRSAGGGEDLPNTLTVTKEGTNQGLGAFVVAVDGELEPFDDSESVVVGSRALDWVGPARGTDRLGFSGRVTDLVLKGNARVYVNGSRVNPDAV